MRCFRKPFGHGKRSEQYICSPEVSGLPAWLHPLHQHIPAVIGFTTYTVDCREIF